MKHGYDIQPCPDTCLVCPIIILNQGEYYISGHETVAVRTILGSCVTVTMFCPIIGIGAVTHSLLPHPFRGSIAGPGHQGRFVVSSIHYVFERMLALGVKRNNMVVKVFGGSQMLQRQPANSLGLKFNIGRRNTEMALKTIFELGLKIAATDVGGNCGRELMFFSHCGDVWIKKIIRFQTANPDIS